MYVCIVLYSILGLFVRGSEDSEDLEDRINLLSAAMFFRISRPS